MLKKKLILFLSALFIITLTACNLPSGQSTTTPDLALTITAQALLLESGAQPSSSAQDTPIPAFTSTLEFTSTPAFTSTPSVPTATVSQNTNCRTGPGTQYGLIGGLLVGQSAEVVGKNSASNYWIIKTPGGSGTCWLWGQYATVSGNVAALQEYAIPPTPTPSPTFTPSPTPTPTSTPNPPAAVTNLVAAKVCIPLVTPNYQYTGNITWQDNSNNEKGFNVYFNGGLSGTVGPNITTHPIPPLVFPMGTPITLSVEAFNDGGKSAKVDVVIVCP